jgi:hypothetical protein
LRSLKIRIRVYFGITTCAENTGFLSVSIHEKR